MEFFYKVIYSIWIFCIVFVICASIYLVNVSHNEHAYCRAYGFDDVKYDTHIHNGFFVCERYVPSVSGLGIDVVESGLIEENFWGIAK